MFCCVFCKGVGVWCLLCKRHQSRLPPVTERPLSRRYNACVAHRRSIRNASHRTHLALYVERVGQLVLVLQQAVEQRLQLRRRRARRHVQLRA